MKRLRVLAVLLVICSSALSLTAQSDSTAGGSGIGDTDFPLLGNGGYDVQHYDLTLDVPMDDTGLRGTAIISATAEQDLAAFNLDFSGLQVDSLTVNDQPATFQRVGGEMTVTPADPLAAGSDFTVTVAYSGVPHPPTNPAIGFSDGWNFLPGHVVVASEPTGADTWYPVNNHPLDKATYTFHITVPQPYTAVANGVLTATDPHGDTNTYHWDMRQPMASYLTEIQIDQFSQQTDTSGSVPVRNYFPTANQRNGARRFAHQSAMIDYFASLFGAYPFDAYGVVVVDQDLYFALENQSMTLFGVNFIVGARDQIRADVTISHELAHQWFGDSVSLSQWSDIWLNEGFATYASWLWLEHTMGTGVLNSVVSDNYNTISGNDALAQTQDSIHAAAAAAAFVPPGSPPLTDLFNDGVYLRGALLLHALRLTIGEDAFFRVLHTYADTYRYSNATSADFIAIAERFSGQDLSAFFQSWLYDTAVPNIPQMGLENRVS